jgi:succinate-semialdehyde dehydrogenase/glutarate-semialdehyde dehydrogenase
MEVATNPGQSATKERAVLAKIPTELLIGKSWQPAASGRRLEIEDPSTGHILATDADGEAVDALAALDAATEAQAAWSASPPRLRGEILRRAFEPSPTGPRRWP